MNDQVILLGYLAFSTLKKLIPKAELIDIIPKDPYVSIELNLPFELDQNFITLFKEDLKREIKQCAYTLKEMVPAVALEYLKHKKVKLNIDLDSPTVTLFETPFSVAEVKEGALACEKIEANLAFDVVESHFDDHARITLVCGEETKELKKLFKKNFDFPFAEFLKKSSVMDERGKIQSRGHQVFNYYKNFVLNAFSKIGIIQESDEPKLNIFCENKNLNYQDPWIVPGGWGESINLLVKIPNFNDPLSSCLNSLIKIPKILGFSYQIEIQGKFTEQELKSLDHENPLKCSSAQDGKRIKLNLIDAFKRKTVFASFQLSRKTIEVSVDLLPLVLNCLLKTRKLYPEGLARPKQIGVLCTEGEGISLLYSQMLERQLEGASCFFLEQNELISDKQALDYQLSELMYYSLKDKKVLCRQYT